MNSIPYHHKYVNVDFIMSFTIKNINDKKNSIANIWQDSQYDDFAEFIDKIIKDVIDAIKVYDEYILLLDNKIKELN